MHPLKALCATVSFFLAALVLCVIFFIIVAVCSLQVVCEECVTKLRRLFYAKLS